MFDHASKVVIEAEEDAAETQETEGINSNNQMSSRGGEASGAAASGRGRDSAARPRGRGFQAQFCGAAAPPESTLRSTVGGGGLLRP